jgi:hypothetical protein
MTITTVGVVKETTPGERRVTLAELKTLVA